MEAVVIMHAFSEVSRIFLVYLTVIFNYTYIADEFFSQVLKIQIFFTLQLAKILENMVVKFRQSGLRTI